MTTIQNGVKALPLSSEYRGHQLVIHPTLLWDENDLVLIDTGIPGQLEAIRALLEQEDLSFDQVTKIIITHQDSDHIGNLAELVRITGGRAQVLAHEIAVPYLTGELPLIKTKATAEPVKVDVALKDGDIISAAGGIQVIFTPGHTPDHISLFHLPSRTLIAGDALTADNGVLQSFSPAYTLDHQTALQSVGKLQVLDIDTVIAYHGGVCQGGIPERLEEIARNTSV